MVGFAAVLPICDAALSAHVNRPSRYSSTTGATTVRISAHERRAFVAIVVVDILKSAYDYLHRRTLSSASDRRVEAR